MIPDDHIAEFRLRVLVWEDRARAAYIIPHWARRTSALLLLFQIRYMLIVSAETARRGGGTASSQQHNTTPGTHGKTS